MPSVITRVPLLYTMLRSPIPRCPPLHGTRERVTSHLLPKPIPSCQLIPPPHHCVISSDKPLDLAQLGGRERARVALRDDRGRCEAVLAGLS